MRRGSSSAADRRLSRRSQSAHRPRTIAEFAGRCNRRLKSGIDGLLRAKCAVFQSRIEVPSLLLRSALCRRLQPAEGADEASHRPSRRWRESCVERADSTAQGHDDSIDLSGKVTNRRSLLAASETSHLDVCRRVDLCDFNRHEAFGEEWLEGFKNEEALVRLPARPMGGAGFDVLWKGEGAQRRRCKAGLSGDNLAEGCAVQQPRNQDE